MATADAAQRAQVAQSGRALADGLQAGAAGAFLLAGCATPGDATLLAADLAATKAESAAWRAAAEHARLATMRQAERHERTVAAYETRLCQLQGSPAYRLGETLLHGLRKPGRWLALPGGLLPLRRPSSKRDADLPLPGLPLAEAAIDPPVGPPDVVPDRDEAPTAAPLAPLPPMTPATLARTEERARKKAQQQEQRARAARADAHAARARALRHSDPVAAAQAAQAAHDADPQPWRAKWLAFRLHDAGELTRPAALLQGLPQDVGLSASESSRAQQILALAAMAQALPELPPVAAPAYDPRPQSLLYCAASALPWHTSGYTTRTQALLQALAAQGVDLVALTRAGYPWDRADSAGTPEALATRHDGLDWQHLRQPSQSLPLDIYIERASIGIARLAKARRVAAIQAASNHVNALPALLAARRLGIPFHYELRGLWEMSRAANVPGFAGTERHALGLELEAFVARAATRVFAISQPLADHVIAQWRLDPARVALLPNGIDSAGFASISADPLPRTTIGYAGALVSYEGLDLLIEALALLKAQGLDIDLLVMGDGPLRASLEEQAQRLGLAQAVTFTGRLDPAQARARMAACHIACLPRRRSDVTELVPPIKLVEAMALGLPAVVPDLPVFRAEAQHGETALFFTPDHAADLAHAIATLATDPALAQQLGQAARSHAAANRDWNTIANAVVQTLPQAEPEPEPEPTPEPAVLAAAEEAQRRAQALQRAEALTRQARALYANDLPAAIALAEEAQALDPQPWRAKWLAFRWHEAGDTVRAAQLLQALPANLALSRSERSRIDKILAPRTIAPAPTPEPAPDPAALAAAEQAQRRAQALQRAEALTRQARALYAMDLPAAIALAEEAQALDPQPWRAKWLAFRWHEAGDTARAAQLLQALPANLALSRSERSRIDQILAPPTVAPAPTAEPAPDPAALAATEQAQRRAQALQRAEALTHQARAVCARDLPTAIALAEEAQALDPQPWRAKWLAFRWHEAGDTARATQLLQALPTDLALSRSERSRIRQILTPLASKPMPDPAEAEEARRRAQALDRADALTRQARTLYTSDLPAAIALAEEAQTLDPQPWRAKWLAFRWHEAGDPARAVHLLQSLPADLAMSRSERGRIERILNPPAPEPAPDPEALAAAEEAHRRSEAQALARRLTEQARTVQDTDPHEAARLGLAAHDADPQPWRAKWLAFRLHDAGELTRPAALLQGLPQDVGLSASESSRAQQILALAAMAQALPELPPVAAPAYDPRPQSLLYCAASALPWHTSGYTTRTQALLQALAAQGVDLVALTRAGYPWDRADSAGTPEALATRHDGLDWQHLRQPSQSLPLDIYIERASIGIARLAKARRVAAIQAASNHVNALPALLAARRLGIPFHYELRGLWEMSRAANVPGFAGTERHALGLELEAFVARAATRVFAISQPLADHVIAQWRLDPARVALLPNGIDSAGFASISADPLPRTTIGYAGALVSYEGLDLLIEALALLKAQGLDIDLLVMGDGPLRASLEEQAQRLGLAQAVTFTGRLDPAQARARMAACHIACLPRRRSDVTELVPPIKLVEAMALGLPAVVPDLPVFRAEAQHGETALFFTPDHAADLARAIATLATDPALAQRLGQAARSHAAANRDWNTIANAVVHTLPSRDIDAQDGGGDLAEPSGDGWIVPDAESLIAALVQANPAPARAAMATAPFTDAAQAAREWLRLGKAAGEAGAGTAELCAAEEAVGLDRGLATLAGAYAAAQRAGAFDHCAQWMLEMRHHPDARADRAAQARIERLAQGLAGQLDLLHLITPRRARALAPVPGRVCYMLHNSLPYATGGYATRTHGLACGMAAAGCEVLAMTRPGFPYDAVAGLADGDVPEAEVIDGITYLRTPNPARIDMRYVHYIPAAARALEERYRALRPALVMAASNHLVALPALIAARRLGIPFAYEVRGFWEVTKMSREESYRATPAYQVQERLEAAIAQAADQVFTLTGPMAEELVARGVEPGKIALLPNSCDPARFTPRPRDIARAHALGIPADVQVIGYVGTFVDYEGLDDLAAACALLKAQGHAFRLLLVGSENTSGSERGPIAEAIADIAARGGFAEWLIMPGRVPHDEVESWYSLIDVCPFPRKPWPVCEMVSPMKPLEALAMEKAVVVSDVRALAEMIAHEDTGLAFAKGDVASLAQALARLIGDPALRAALGRRGRRWVEAERTWLGVGEQAVALMQHDLAQAPGNTLAEAAE
ncbi:glycosyltransferase [Novosphingobium sp. SG720]|uniref:glycosyltransferase n=1 Tax=Novosphingobium sp. SG720 TaxID=2586998 RepID=UPI001446C387|nr:glycosyltransferase [Novosphingobium sp. SG720]NKJ43120.1 glycosyltransferase involved in cell wall biosynthesis [Novosphingobium sp. SG720]